MISLRTDLFKIVINFVHDIKSNLVYIGMQACSNIHKKIYI